jgi:glycosyltransferase involved in cell wall biosynthesis
MNSIGDQSIDSQATDLKYALVTPARNEEAFIEQTIRSVIAQSVTPVRWVIVSDGSTDRTNDIVNSYARSYEWIELLALPERSGRHFGAKARAFGEGYARLRGLRYDIIGNVDADISFGPNYIHRLLTEFVRDPALGVAGSPFREGTAQYDIRFSRKDHVSGACQLFRRQCFEMIGGYVPQRIGGIDVIAVISARMKGWRTETFADQFCTHHRPMGSANDRFVTRLFKSGHGDYCLGVHPIWQISRCIYQMSRRPYIVGGGLLLSGYAWAFLTRAHKPVSEEFVRFRKQEQMEWLATYVKQWLRVQTGPTDDVTRRGVREQIR